MRMVETAGSQTQSCFVNLSQLAAQRHPIVSCSMLIMFSTLNWPSKLSDLVKFAGFTVDAAALDWLAQAALGLPWSHCR
jgi:hypothetical protein